MGLLSAIMVHHMHLDLIQQTFVLIVFIVSSREQLILGKAPAPPTYLIFGF